MSPKAVQVLSLLLIAAAVILGAIAIVIGHWGTLPAMALIILAQGIVLRKARTAGPNKRF